MESLDSKSLMMREGGYGNSYSQHFLAVVQDERAARLSLDSMDRHRWKKTVVVMAKVGAPDGSEELLRRLDQLEHMRRQLIRIFVAVDLVVAYAG